MDKVRKAAEILKRGGIVIFPTDTVFGVGCILSDEKAVERLYKIKKRPKEMPTLLLVKDLSQAEHFVEFNNISKKLAKNFWPGPLTMVVKSKSLVPKIILGEDGTVGLRVPNHEISLKLIELVGEPILAPSANFKGENAPSKLSEIDKRLLNLVDYVTEIECGGEKPSTVVEVLGKSHRIIRNGPITNEQIFKTLRQ